MRALQRHGGCWWVKVAMALDDPTMDEDLRTALAAHEIVLEEEWADVE